MDRPLFDDESLPNWLKKPGITFVGRKRQTIETPAQPVVTPPLKMATTEMPVWMQNVETDAANTQAPAESGATPLKLATGEMPVWMQNTASEPAEAAAPSWMQDAESISAAQHESSLPSNIP